MTTRKKAGHVVDLDALPHQFPTHKHAGAFWESLGRAVATFGFLEEVLGKAIFSFTATRQYDNEEKVREAYEDWLPRLERALSDPLGALINAYGKAVRDHSGATIRNLDELLDRLREAANTRNVLCHGSWRLPNAAGASIPLFVNRKKMIFDAAIDHQYLAQVQRGAAELACAVISTVTDMGWQFPGSAGPGKPLSVVPVEIGESE